MMWTGIVAAFPKSSYDSKSIEMDGVFEILIIKCWLARISDEQFLDF